MLKDEREATSTPLLAKNSLSIQNYIQSSAIFDYIQRYLNNELSEIPPRKIHQALRAILALMGSAWGIPWTTASADAAIIFSSEKVRVVFEKLFAAGIVITVGGDGLWIMLSLGDNLKPELPEELLLTRKIESRSQKGIRLTSIAILALISCISSVYAAAKYNSGGKKFLSLIVLVVNYCYGLYGYSALTDKLIHRIKLMNPQYRELTHKKEEWIAKLAAIIDSKANFSEVVMEPTQFIEYVQNFNLEVKSSATKKSIKPIIQTASCLTVSLASSIVSFYLSKDAFKEDIYDNSTASIIAALFAELPGFIITMISTYDVFGRFYDLLLCQDMICKQSSEASLPKKLISPIAFIFSLGAPSAAAFITYSTLDDEGLNRGLIFSATIAISLARVIFSNFTLYNLTHRGLSSIPTKKIEDQESLKKKQLIKLHSTLSKTDPGFFGEIFKIHSKEQAQNREHEGRKTICGNCIIL